MLWKDLQPRAHGKLLNKTPKACANFSPGLERSDNPGNKRKVELNPERVRLERNPFRVNMAFLFVFPGLSHAPTLGLKLANASGVKKGEAVEVRSVRYKN